MNLNEGIEMRYKQKEYPMCVSTQNIIELKEIVYNSKFISVGSSASLADIRDAFRNFRNQVEYPRVLDCFLENLRWFGGPQTLNVAVTLFFLDCQSRFIA